MPDEHKLRLRMSGFGLNFSELPLAARSFLATALLVLIGGIAAPSTVNSAAILSTLPYFAILAVASIGQHLVVQQRGLDLSTAGIMSFAAVVVTKLPGGSGDFGVVIFYVLLALAVGAAIGAATGLIVTLLHVPPLVTTIGVNAILFGLTYYVSTGASVQAPPMLVSFFVARFLYVPTTVWVPPLLTVVKVATPPEDTTSAPPAITVVLTAIPPDTSWNAKRPLTVVKLAVPPEDTTSVANVPTVVLTVVPSTYKVSPELVTKPLDVVPDATVGMPGVPLNRQRLGLA